MRKVLEAITATDGSKAELVQHGRHTFSLTIISRKTGHNRWGTRKEIAEDVEFFTATGRLPVSGQRW